MLFRVIDGKRSFAVSRTALISTIASSLLSAQANAQAIPAPPTGCDRGLFTTGNNTIPAAATAAGTSLAAAEASTAQVMELVAQRRAQEAEACPANFIKVGGACQPVRRITSTSQPASSAPATPVNTGATLTSSAKPSAARRLSAGTPDRRRSDVSPDDVSVKPEPVVERNAVWSEAFADYERRTGLGDATSSASRSQRTAGLVVGADHAVQNGYSGIVFGLVGGVSDTRQEFQRSSSQQLDTNYIVDLSKEFAFQDPNFTPTSFSYLLPENHTFDSLQKQTLTGPSLGWTLSFFRGGFFSDAIVKADFLDLKRTSTVSDTYGRTLNANFEQIILDQNGQVANPQGQAPGCINLNDQNGPINPPYTITNRQTTTTVIAQQTSAINFIVAENLGYHFDLPQGNWIEPLIGARYSYSTYGSNAASLGLEDGHAIRVQGGARFGFTRFVLDRYVWTTSLTTLLYSDVLISGFVTNADGFSAGALLADQGKLRVQGALTSKVDLLNGVSTFAEVQTRYGQDYWGIGGRVGARYEW